MRATVIGCIGIEDKKDGPGSRLGGTVLIERGVIHLEEEPPRGYKGGRPSIRGREAEVKFVRGMYEVDGIGRINLLLVAHAEWRSASGRHGTVSPQVWVLHLANP